MAIETCGSCGTLYAVGLPRCPHCRGDHEPAPQFQGVPAEAGAGPEAGLVSVPPPAVHPGPESASDGRSHPDA